MTLSQFVDKWLGKQVEYHSYDPRAKYQCVDLVNQYIVEVLGLTPVKGTDAKDFPTRINQSEFEVIKNTPEFLPRSGDIVVWNGRVGGGAGHIAIVFDEKPTLSKFWSFDQNWSKPLYTTMEQHNYTNVSYFLRSRKHMTIDSETFEKLVTKSSRYDEFVNAGFETYQKVQNRFDELQGSINTLKDELKASQSLVEQSRKDLKELVAELSRLLDTRQEISEVIGAVSRAVKAEDKLTDELTKISEEREKHAQTVQDLRAEVAYWKTLAEQGDVLANMKMEHLLKEIVRRLTSIVR